MGPTDTIERDLSVRGDPESYDISEEGRRYVISASVGGDGTSAFLGGLDGTPLVRLGQGLGNSISPDGRTVLVWKASGEGVGTALALLPTGAGEPRDVPRGTIRTYQDTRFLPGGRRLLMSASEADRPRRLFVQELPDGLPKPVTPEGVFTENAYATPDGSWVPAGSDYESEPYKLYPLAGGEPRPIPGLEKGDQPIRFTAEGQRLFVRVRTKDEARATIALLDLDKGRKRPWKILGPADPAGVTGISLLFPTPDGRAYVYDYWRVLSDLFLVRELK